MEEESMVNSGLGIKKVSYRRYLLGGTVLLVITLSLAAWMYFSSDPAKSDWIVVNAWWLALASAVGILGEGYWRIRRAKRQGETTQERKPRIQD